MEGQRRLRNTRRGSFGVRAGSRELESDLAHEYLGQGSYRYDPDGTTCRRPAWRERSRVIRRSSNGSRSVTRRRSAAGTSSTSRQPAGTAWLLVDRVSLYGTRALLDIGSVWDANTERHVRVSTGFGFHAGPAFFVVGFPLNTDNLSAVVAMGLRIPGVGIRW